jgi:tetratricopeptide (TPR) repeat protein
MGWFVPEVLGVGYGHVSEALNGQMALTMMALLVVLKLIATAACYGTGNAGGIFGPSLFIGAMLGGAVGSAAHQLFPDYTGSVGAYALVGMGAAFAGIVRVPLASVIMIFEMTRDYSIIVPLMISNLMSFYISYKLQEEPIYEALAHQDGLHLPSGLKYRQGMLMVRHAMTTASYRLSPSDRLRDALACFSEDRNACPVVNDSELLGMVSRVEVEAALNREEGDRALSEVFPSYGSGPGPPESLRSESFPHVHVDHPLDVALRRMAQSKLNVLPVVSRSNVRELRGLVSLAGVLRAYGVAQEPTLAEPALEEETRTSPRFVPGMIAALLVLVFLIGFLHYFYRSQRGERAEQYFKTGSGLLLQGRNQEAVEEFRNALSISPNSQQYRLSLGLTLAKSGQPGEGAVYLNEILKRDPNNGAANLGLARIAASRVKTSDAITYYHRAIYGTWPTGEENNRLEARFELADYLKKSGLQKEAIAELLAALEQARNNYAAKKRIGRLLLEYGSPRQAADVFEDILRANNRDAQAWASLGTADLAQEDYHAARNALRNAVRFDPSDAQAQRQQDLAERILALDPNKNGLRASDRYTRSVEIVTRALQVEQACAAIKNDPVADAARKQLAHRARRGEIDDAIDLNLNLAVRLWQSAKNLCPSQPQKDEALDRVLARVSRQ